jgi:hypothetical protein
VAAGSPTDVWAVGGSTGPTPNDTVTRVLRYDGSGWREVPFPLGNTPSIVQITGLAAAGGHAWLVGNKLSAAVIQEWDGRSWQERQPPADCLQGGTSADGMPTFCNITAVTAFAPDDVWACGNANWPGFRGPLLFHWDGTRWRAVQVGIEAQGSAFTAIGGRSHTEVWAAGGPQAGSLTGSRPVAVHGDGRSWQAVAGGLPGTEMADIGVDAAGQPWLIENSTAPGAALATYGPAGAWSGTDAPQPPDAVGISLRGIAAVPGGALMFAVGDVDLPTTPRLLRAVILEYSSPDSPSADPSASPSASPSADPSASPSVSPSSTAG